MRKFEMDRRQFLRTLGFSGLAIASPPLLSACREILTQSSPPAFQGEPDVEVRLTAKPDVHPIFPGTPTQVWRYEGEVLKGLPDTLNSSPESYLGPTFQVETGTKVRVHFINSIGEPSIIHWHGLYMPEEVDGHPRFAVGDSGTYIYDFQVMDRAGTYWYHPHPHRRTGPQVYRGLAGLFLIHDQEEAALDLPTDDQDLPLVIQDRIFDNDNQLVYSTTGMMTQMVGMLGDEILVNGSPDYKIDVDRRAYRLRLLNGSNARIYKLAWDDGTPLTVIGTEGGLLEEPIVQEAVTLAPAQRIELWVDFGAWQPRTTLRMVNQPSSAPGSAREMPIFTASVQDTEKQESVLPEKLTQHQSLDLSQAVNAKRPRSFTLAMGRGMR
jgi:FtsP/CotA-like multicopper oxidase with cupredoxin domain